MPPEVPFGGIKTSYLLEKDFVHFVSESIFKRLKFDYSSSETVSNQKIRIRTVFLMPVYLPVYSWRSD